MENNFAPKIIHVISRMNVGGPARMIQELMHIDKSVAEQFLITGICQEGEIDFRDSHPELHSIELKNLGRDINLISDLILKLNFIEKNTWHILDMLFEFDCMQQLLLVLYSHIYFRSY